MVVGRGGAARQQQFRHRHGDAEMERFRRQPRPDRIQRLQPRKQFAIERRRQRPGQRLVEMMMGVDQAGQHDVGAGVIYGGVGGRRFPAARHQLDDFAAADHNAAFGAVGENRKRILDPDRLRLVHDPT
jgi:hypothetical protein